jgi:hypothetical protein
MSEFRCLRDNCCYQGIIESIDRPSCPSGDAAGVTATIAASLENIRTAACSSSFADVNNSTIVSACRMISQVYGLAFRLNRLGRQFDACRRNFGATLVQNLTALGDVVLNDLAQCEQRNVTQLVVFAVYTRGLNQYLTYFFFSPLTLLLLLVYFLMSALWLENHWDLLLALFLQLLLLAQSAVDLHNSTTGCSYSPDQVVDYVHYCVLSTQMALEFASLLIATIIALAVGFFVFKYMGKNSFRTFIIVGGTKALRCTALPPSGTPLTPLPAAYHRYTLFSMSVKVPPPSYLPHPPPSSASP